MLAERTVSGCTRPASEATSLSFSCTDQIVTSAMSPSK